MMIADTPLVVIAGRLGIILLLISMILALIRLVKGPNAADRIVALDLISVLIIGFLAAFSIYAGETSFLDVAIGYALIAFLGTVALTRFLIRSAQSIPENKNRIIDSKTNNE